MFIAILVAACTILASCLRVPPHSVDALASLERAPEAYAYACPPANRTEQHVRGVCVASFRPDDGPLDAPALALGPRDGLVAVAGSGAPLARVFLSTNGGADWQPALLPRDLAPAAGPGETISTGRVALEFDGQGRLHLVAELFRSSDSTRSGELVDLYYASSSDLGKTWKAPVMLPTNGSGAFPKLTVWADRLFVTWGYRGGYRLNLASSTDGGTSWSQAKGAPDDCINTSEVAVLRGMPYIACAGFRHQGDAEAAPGRNPFTGLRLYRLDPSRELSLVASLDSFKGVWPRLFVAPDGALVLLAKLYRVHSPPTKGWDKCCAAVARSVDDGRTWSEPVDLRQALQSDDDWDTFNLSDARLDAWGFLHFIANGSDQADPANGSPGTDARLVHAAFDPASGRLLGESPLTPPTDGPQGYYPAGASLAFSRSGGVASWTYDKGLDYTQLEPKGPSAQSFAVRQVRVFDGDRVHTDMTVVVQDGVIQSLQADTNTPPGIDVIDGAGRTLLPGLVDAHTHMWGNSLRQTLAFGVTTVLDMFTSPSWAAERREEQRQGMATGQADLLSAGLLVTAPGGHGTQYEIEVPTITTPEEAREAVETRLAQGSDYIKIIYQPCEQCMPSIDSATMQAVIAETHRRDRKAVVHVHTLEHGRTAIQAGADGIAHLFADRVADAAFLALIRERDAFVVTTLSVIAAIGGEQGAEALVAHPEVGPYLSGEDIKRLITYNPRGRTNPWFQFDSATTSLRVLADRGVPILAGSDAPNIGTAWGASIHRELELMVRAGLSPTTALRSATSVPANVFDLHDRGRIAPGLRADLLLVDGDPTADILATRNIVAIWKQGVRFDRKAYRTALQAQEDR